MQHLHERPWPPAQCLNVASIVNVETAFEDRCGIKAERTDGTFQRPQQQNIDTTYRSHPTFRPASL